MPWYTDPTTGETWEQPDEEYVEQLKQALVTGQLSGEPQPDGSWVIRAPSEAQRAQLTGGEVRYEPPPPPPTPPPPTREEAETLAERMLADEARNKSYDPTGVGAYIRRPKGQDAHKKRGQPGYASVQPLLNGSPFETQTKQPVAGWDILDFRPSFGAAAQAKEAGFDAVLDTPSTLETETGERFGVGEQKPQIPTSILNFAREKFPEVAYKARLFNRDAFDPEDYRQLEELRGEERVHVPIPETEEFPTGGEPWVPGQGLDMLRQARERMTGETDPAIQQAIMEGLGGVPAPIREELLAVYRQRRHEWGMSPKEAWDSIFKPDRYGHSLAQEIAQGNAIDADVQVYGHLLNALDPVTTVGKAVLGEERWKSLPEPVQTAAEWAPILLAPQKGLIKDLVFGGMGRKMGTFAIAGAVAGEQVAKVAGLEEHDFFFELGGALVTPQAVGRRWLDVEAALKGARLSEEDMARQLLPDSLLDDEQFVDDLSHFFDAEDAGSTVVVKDLVYRRQGEARGRVNADQAQPEPAIRPDAEIRPSPDLRERVLGRAAEAVAAARSAADSDGIPVYAATSREAAEAALRSQGQEVRLLVDDDTEAVFLFESGELEVVMPEGTILTVRLADFPDRESALDALARFVDNELDWRDDGQFYGAEFQDTLGDDEFANLVREALRNDRTVAEGSRHYVRENVPVGPHKLHFEGYSDGEITVSFSTSGRSMHSHGGGKAGQLADLRRMLAEVVKLQNRFPNARIIVWGTTDHRARAYQKAGFVLINPRPDGIARAGDRMVWKGGEHWLTPELRAEVDEYTRMLAEKSADQEIVLWRAVDEDTAVTIDELTDTSVPLDADPEIARLRAAAQDGVRRPVLVSVRVRRGDLVQRDGAFYLRKAAPVVANEAVEGWLHNAGHMVRSFLRGQMNGVELRVPGEVPVTAAPTPASEQTIFLTEQERAAWSTDAVRRNFEDSRVDAARLVDQLDHIIDVGAVDLPQMVDDALMALTVNLDMGTELYYRTGGREGLGPRMRRAIQQFMAELEGIWDPNQLYVGIPVVPVLRTVAAAGRALKTAVRGAPQPSAAGAAIPPPGVATPLPGLQYTVGSQGVGRLPVRPQHTNRLFSKQPLIPRLNIFDRFWNNMRKVVGYDLLGPDMHPLARAIIDDWRRTFSNGGLIDNLSNIHTSEADYLVNRKAGWKVDKKGRIQGLPGAPTIQDLAAKLPSYWSLLTDTQKAVMMRLRQIMEPFTNALIEQGLDIHTRRDIMDGGFYLPRGGPEVRSTGQRLTDAGKVGKVVGPTGRGIKKSFEQEAEFDSMVQGIEGVKQPDGSILYYEYPSFVVALDQFIRDAADRVWHADIAHRLANATDEAGVPLGLTPEARLLMDPNNVALREAIGRLRHDVKLLADGIDGLDNDIHAILRNFVATPAPNLTDLRLALNKLYTRGGVIRYGLTTKEVRDRAKALYQVIRRDIWRNRGVYKGLTGEQARKQALKDALNKTVIRRGKFKGMSFAQGKAHLEQLKKNLANLEELWRKRLTIAQSAGPSLTIPGQGRMTLENYKFGSLLTEGNAQMGILRGHQFDEALASSLNDFLQGLKPPSRVRNLPIMALRAATVLLKTMRATMDFSFMFIQGLIGLAYEKEAYGMAMTSAIRSFFDPINGHYVLGKYIADFNAYATANGLPTAEDWVRAGLRMGGADTEFLPGARQGPGATIGHLPGIRHSNRAFGYFGDLLRLDGAQKQFLINGIGLMPAQREQMLKEIAESQNLMTGWAPGRVGGAAGDFVLFAPRFFQAQLELLFKALPGTKVGKHTKHQVRAMLTHFLGQGVALTAAYNILNAEEDFNWWSPTVNGQWNPNFMRMRVGNTDVSLFGPWDSLIRAIYQAATGDPFYILRTKGQPLVTIAWDTLTGETFTGEKAPRIKNLVKDVVGELRSAVTGTEYDASGDWGLMSEYVLRHLLPFSVTDPVTRVFFRGENPVSQISTLVAGETGLKASPLSLSEETERLNRRVIDELIRESVIPPSLVEMFKNTPYSELGAQERKLISRERDKRYPEFAEHRRTERLADENIYELIAQQADGAREASHAEYDDLLAMLLNGHPPKDVWEAYDKVRNQLAGRLAQVYGQGVDSTKMSAETRKYREEVAKLRPNDMRWLEDAWNAIVTKNERGPNIIDWDQVEKDRIEFLKHLTDTDYNLAQRFVYSLQLKEQFDLEDSHPLVKFRKTVNEALAEFYAIPEDDKQARENWLITHPEADFGRWMTATWDNPKVNSVRAAEMALSVPGRQVQIEGTRQYINRENLPILQRYAKEIMQLKTVPTEAQDANGRTFSPRTRLRQNDPLYDALYYWMGFSEPGEDGYVVVYNLPYVQEWIRRYGPRSDKAPPRQAAR